MNLVLMHQLPRKTPFKKQPCSKNSQERAREIFLVSKIFPTRSNGPQRKALLDPVLGGVQTSLLHLLPKSRKALLDPLGVEGSLLDAAYIVRKTQICHFHGLENVGIWLDGGWNVRLAMLHVSVVTLSGMCKTRCRSSIVA